MDSVTCPKCNTQINLKEYDICPECSGKMKIGGDVCSKCKYVKCVSCDKFIKKSTNYKTCYNCSKKSNNKIV